MPDPAPVRLLGRVLTSSATGFCFGCSAPQPSAPAMGAFVSATGGGTASIVGVIADIRVVDDLFARQLVADSTGEAFLRDQRTFRMVPLEVSVLHAGYFPKEGPPRHRLPPQPPIALEPVAALPPAEVRAFLADPRGGWQFAFLNLLLAAGASNEMLAETLAQAAEAAPEAQRASFRQEAAREAARLLAGDLQRLYALLPQIRG